MFAALSPLDAVESYGESPSAFLALNEGNEYFTAPGLSGSIAYRKAGRYLIQVAEPFAPEEHRSELLVAFLSFARKLGSHIVAVQLQRHVAELYAKHGFVVNQIGASYVVDLAQFGLRGKKLVRLRNKISRATRCGLEVTEADSVDVGEELDEIDLLWLRGKGRFTKELRLLIGERTGAYQGRRRLWVGRIDGGIVAYVSYSPVYGPRAGWLHDLTRRRPDAPPGVMEAIVSTSIDVMREEGCGWFHHVSPRLPGWIRPTSCPAPSGP